MVIDGTQVTKDSNGLFDVGSFFDSAHMGTWRFSGMAW